jgi:hypothetical protein
MAHQVKNRLKPYKIKVSSGFSLFKIDFTKVQKTAKNNIKKHKNFL